MRLLLSLVLGFGILYYLYDNMDNPSLRALQAVIEREIGGSNMVVMLDQLGTPSSVSKKLVNKGVIMTSIVAVDNTDFNSRKLGEIANQYQRPAVGMRFQLEEKAGYTLITVIRLEANGTLSSKQVRVNYEAKADKWIPA